MVRQLTLDLWQGEAMGAGDFFISDSNRAAHAMVTGDAGWPQGRLALIGPHGAGKSHLAQIWAARSGAGIVTADMIPALPLPAPDAALVIEGVAHLPHDAEEPLFHLLNHLGATGGQVLFTAHEPPARWQIALPDLRSRLLALPLIRIHEPDDALLAALLVKLFADRGIAPEAGLIPWLVLRMERSFAAAHAAVTVLESTALSEGRALTRAYARDVLLREGAGADILGGGALDNDDGGQS